MFENELNRKPLPIAVTVQEKPPIRKRKQTEERQSRAGSSIEWLDTFSNEPEAEEEDSSDEEWVPLSNKRSSTRKPAKRARKSNAYT